MNNNRQMRKLVFAIAILMFPFMVSGQHSGSFLTVAGGVGGGGFQYNLKGVSSDGVDKDKFGWNAKIGYSYYFTPHWGLGTGVGISYYRTVGRYNSDFVSNTIMGDPQGEYHLLGKYIDDDHIGVLKDYELRVRLSNWHEEQKSYFIEIPLMVMFQHKFGETKKHGIYAGLGAKLQIPIIKSVYKVLDGKDGDLRLNVSGKYEGDRTLDLGQPGDPNLPGHGFGSISNPGTALDWGGDLRLKMSIAGTAEFGFLFGLGRRVDLMVGGYFDYGFNNIKKGENAAFMTSPNEYHPESNRAVGNGIGYNGMINTDRTEKVNLMAYGGKIGLQIKLGKIEDVEAPKTLPPYLFDDEEEDDDLELMQQQLDEMRRLMQELLLLMSEEEEEVVEEEETDPIVVRGNVYDSQTKEALEGAVVELIDARTNRLIDIRYTNEAGAFKMPAPSFGRYILEVRKSGYLYSSEEFVIPSTNDKQVIEKIVYLDKIRVNQAIVLKNIFFDTGKSTLKPESMTEIDRVYKLMMDNPSMEIEISGHTDNMGSAASNKTLSLNRASVVVKTLISKGIDPRRMTSAGYGFDNPIAPNTTAEGRAQNRRTEFKVTKM